MAAKTIVVARIDRMEQILDLPAFRIDNLGLFKIKHFPERKLKHARTGEIITIPARNVLKFAQDKNVRLYINK